jgi:hypothetical protein
MTAQSQPRPQSPVRRSSSAAKPKSADPYYGHEETAKMCARFITALFSCPDIPPISSTSTTNPNAPPPPTPTLAVFIAYALHRTRLNSSVTFCALFLLSRLKGRFPAARGSSGHRLFISAFMIASKVVCDDTYSNKSWCVVGQGMFSLREINQMEREMCSYLEWVLNVKPEELKAFEEEVRRDYGSASGKPTSQPIAQPIAPSRPHVAPVSQRPASAVNAYPSPDSSPPSPSHSDSTSPASSTCHTPPSMDVPNPVRAKSVAQMLPAKQPSLPPQAVQVKSAETAPITGPPRLARDSSFAFAAPAVW